MMRILDAVANYIVVTVHDEYEQTVNLFHTEAAAKAAWHTAAVNGNEVYIAKIMEVE